MSQLGYVIGLLFVAPLGHRLENRRLVVCITAMAALALAAAALAHDVFWFLIFCLVIGASSTAIQLLVTIAATTEHPASHGQIIGSVTGGLLVGILLAWPVASLVGATLGWRTLYGLQALAMAMVATFLWHVLPQRRPVAVSSYQQLLGLLFVLFAQHAELRGRAFFRPACSPRSVYSGRGCPLS